MWQKFHGNKRWLLLLALAWAALLCSGCGAMSGGKPPQLSLVNIGLEGVGLFEQRMSLALRVQNPNAAEMKIRGLSCTLDINGLRFAQGVSARPVEIPGYGDSLMKVSANVGTGSVLRQLQSLAAGSREAIDYHLQGHAEVSGQGQVPFDQVGDIPLSLLLGEEPVESGRRL